MFEGDRFIDICDEIIDRLPESVYLSFDINRLDLRFKSEAEQVLYFGKRLVDSGRKLIAFDLNEVAPGEDEWDANVASRILYRLADMTAVSNWQ
ncbi:MAG: arginase family protein [Candidatus Obscuribacterales bacterium]|nr:arginase family protein [Candidatus Obscuribacterales bacterium]